jgi:hypothetical protein
MMMMPELFIVDLHICVVLANYRLLAGRDIVPASKNDVGTLKGIQAEILGPLWLKRGISLFRGCFDVLKSPIEPAPAFLSLMSEKAAAEAASVDPARTGPTGSLSLGWPSILT